MAPRAIPTGVPPMGGILNNINSSNINSIYHHPILAAFMARDATPKYSNGGAHGALILAIVVPVFFILFGIIAVLWKSIKTARAAKARRAARGAERRAGRHASRKTLSNRSSHTSHTSRTSRTSRTSQSSRSNGIFDDDVPLFNEVPLHGMPPAHMASSRPSIGRDGRPVAHMPPQTHPLDMHSPQDFPPSGPDPQ